MGLARAAELNHYPGPKHVIELATELSLSDEQLVRTEEIHLEMLEEAKRVGEEIVEKERHLDRRFAHRHIDDSTLRQLTAEIADLYGELRFIHMSAHLRISSVLTSEQVEAYDSLRGYRSVAQPALANESACGAARGIETVLGKGRIVLLGEIHGTNEAPGFAAAVACHALARRLGVTIALELPNSEESVMRDFIEAPRSDGEGELVVDLPFWSKSYQDGRTSEAMLSLIEQARAWRLSGKDIEVILLDDPTDFRERDGHMAKRLLGAVAASPNRFYVALTGNLHNRTIEGSGRMGEKVAKALGRERVTSLNMAHAGGSAWICEATQGCGPLVLGDRDADPAGLVTLFPVSDSRGYDGFYSVGALSASPPAKDRRTGR